VFVRRRFRITTHFIASFVRKTMLCHKRKNNTEWLRAAALLFIVPFFFLFSRASFFLKQAAELSWHLTLLTVRHILSLFL
jgi:hypothetical protein